MQLVKDKSNCITKILMTVTEDRKEYVNTIYRHPAYLIYAKYTM